MYKNFRPKNDNKITKALTKIKIKHRKYKVIYFLNDTNTGAVSVLKG